MAVPGTAVMAAEEGADPAAVQEETAAEAPTETPAEPSEGETENTEGETEGSDNGDGQEGTETENETTKEQAIASMIACVKSEKGESNMRKNTKYDWIIAVSDSDGTGVELEKITETTDGAVKYLLSKIRNDKVNDLDNFVDGSENEDCLEQASEPKTGEVLELSGYNDFEGYHINYTAKRLDSMSL